MSNDCPELNNIKYKTMLLNGNKNSIKSTTSNNISNIEAFLENKCHKNKNEPWSKLDKTIKNSCLHEYAISIAKEYNLNSSEIKILNTFLINALDKKKLQRIKDVQYDKEKGEIVTIPNLIFNKTNRRFTFKKDIKHVSTLKSLGEPQKKKKRDKKQKTQKHKIKSPKISDKIDTHLKEK